MWGRGETSLVVELGDEVGKYGLGVLAFGRPGIGVRAINTNPDNPAIEAISQEAGAGVFGFSGSGAGVVGVGDGAGVVGFSVSSFGVRAQSGNAELIPPEGGGPQFAKCAVQGSSDEGTGVRGDSAHKVGVRGRTLTGDAIRGSAPPSAGDGRTGPFTGRFDGDVLINGRLFARNIPSAHLFSIPMPLAAGLVDLDRKGEAVVKLPKGTGRLHTNFRYQLTPVGGAAPDLHIASLIRGDQFKIAGGRPNIKVSWQIAGDLK
jgi:hypothetical protein